MMMMGVKVGARDRRSVVAAGEILRERRGQRRAQLLLRICPVALRAQRSSLRNVPAMGRQRVSGVGGEDVCVVRVPTRYDNEKIHVAKCRGGSGSIQ
jgi:hypothetical protein